MMPIENIPDWEQRLARQDAFWSCEIIDRPVVHIQMPKAKPVYSVAPKNHASIRDRWMDSEYAAEAALAGALNTDYLGDALPNAYPNLGPEVFSAFFGSELEFTAESSWTIPILKDWSEVDKLKFSRDSFYWKKLIEMTDILLEKGKNKFYTGITDMHPGGDAIAAFRDPMQLNYDMIEAIDQVKSLLAYVTEVYLEVYDFFYNKLTAAGQAICSWANIVSTKKWLIPSNDFSCMVSPKVFNDVFLPSIIAECQHYQACIYHLDGPDALKHLDSLLAIKELSAIQWVYGAGRGRASDWMWVYQRCKKAGKALQINLEVDELDYFMDNLKPEGLWIGLSGAKDRADAEALIAKIARWK